MIFEIKAPTPGESITEVQIANWLVKNGDYVAKDVEIAEIDSDKATLTVNAEAAGTVTILVEAGETVSIGTVIAQIDSDAAGAKNNGRKAAYWSRCARTTRAYTHNPPGCA
jgi:2-oxoglutarate dehydrogenase E2 component (dihydrolipoamide succinyltransferase)